MDDFARDCGYEGKPFEWNLDRRAKLQAELDVIFAHLYKIKRDDLNYILSTFSKLKNKEMEEYKEFKTKRLILEAYDKFVVQFFGKK
ncbi:MAG: hypothetical protein ACTSPY_16985 [Candidatus Helarchaeota archaeon]